MWLVEVCILCLLAMGGLCVTAHVPATSPIRSVGTSQPQSPDANTAVTGTRRRGTSSKGGNHHNAAHPNNNAGDGNAHSNANATAQPPRAQRTLVQPHFAILPASRAAAVAAAAAAAADGFEVDDADDGDNSVPEDRREDNNAIGGRVGALDTGVVDDGNGRPVPASWTTMDADSTEVQTGHDSGQVQLKLPTSARR